MNKFTHFIQKLFLRLHPGNLITFGYHSNLPQRELLVGYVAYAIAGMLLLTLPFSTTVHVPVSEHLFTAVSALSTTGLSTVDIGQTYTFWGQLFILLLIQFGGLGYMTMTSFILLDATQHLGKDQGKLMDSQFSLPVNMQKPRILRNIVGFTFAFEGIGILCLFPYFYRNGIEQPLWSAVFHSISTFCTAGFSLYNDNMMQFRGDIFVNMVLMLLSYMGSMGFIFMTDIIRKIFNRKYHISFTSKIIMKMTAGLSLLTTVHLYFVEPALQQYPCGERFMTALFQSMSAMTTTGFNTIDLTGLVPITLLVLSMTMFIGASPSGTGGGLKSTTICAIFAYTRAKLKMESKITLNGHIIPQNRIDTALTTMIFYSFILFAGVYAMTLFESDTTDCQQLLFEGTSALATTGLTCGALAHLTLGSKLVLIVLMFVGRLGVITLGNALLVDREAPNPHPNHEDLVV